MLDPLGQVFLRMLFFVVIPLVFASLAMGVAQLEHLSTLGPLAVRTFVLFFLNMAIAVTLGLVMMNVIEPGAALEPEARAQLLEEYGGAAAEHVAKRAGQPDVTPMAIVEMFMPRNLFGAFVGSDRNRLGDVLPLILFAILVGAAAVKLREDRREQLRSGLGLVNDLMTGIVHFALRLAPYAVPAHDLQRRGEDRLGHRRRARNVRGRLHPCHVAAPVRDDVGLAQVLARRGPIETFKLMRPVLVTAFSTSSSAATLPDRARGRARGSRRAARPSPASCCRSAPP